ncbi:MAG: hypothetical protein ACTSQY_10220 [Candidatus Odinarchaeia archaeon]
MTEEIKCPKCNTKMVLSTKNFQFGLIELYDTECMKCPKCGYEMYTTEQYKKVMKSLNHIEMFFDGLEM